jgi:hypothetical protein
MLTAVAHVWYDGRLRGATEVSTEDASFRLLQRCATLCNRASFEQEVRIPLLVAVFWERIRILTACKDLASGKDVRDCRTTGDASESALIKFCQPLRDIEEFRRACPQVLQPPLWWWWW